MFRNWFSNGGENAEADGLYRHGNEHLIELRAIVKEYETAAGPFLALRHIDLAVDPGEFVAVIGKSGSGKSTLINMITGIDQPTRGEVLVGDAAVHTLNENQIAEWRGHNVGVVFQFFQLLPTLTVAENVMLPMDFCDLYRGRLRRERALHLLEQVEMIDQADKLPTAISGGQQQRAAIARALANNPSIIVADEPTGNLDSKTADAVFQLFGTLIDEGKTIFMVTHDEDLAHRVTRQIVIADGDIVGDDKKIGGHRGIQANTQTGQAIENTTIQSSLVAEAGELEGESTHQEPANQEPTNQEPKRTSGLLTLAK